MTPATTILYLKTENAYHLKGENRIDFDKRGLVSIIGRNFDAKVDSDEVGLIPSNGTGKSTIIRCLLRVWFGKRAYKSEGVTECMLDGKNGKDFMLESASLRDGHEYMIREVRKHRDHDADGVQFFIDGKRVGRKNSEETYRAEFLKKALGLTYEEFIGTCVITQNSSHTLINGSPQECIDFISKMFGLSRYDELYDKFKIRHDAIQRELQDLIPMRAEYETYTSQLAELPKLSDVKATIEECEARVEKLKARRSTLKAKRDDVKLIAATVSDNKRITAKLGELRASTDLDLAKPKTLLADLKEREEKVTRSLMRAMEARRVAKDVADLREDYQGAIEDMPKEFLDIPLDELRKRYSNVMDKAIALEKDLRLQENNTNARNLGQALVTSIEQKGVTEDELKDVEAAKVRLEECSRIQDELADKISACDNLLNIVEGYNTEHSRCPKCGSHVDPKVLRQTITETKEKLAKLEHRDAENNTILYRNKLIVDYATFMRVNAWVDLDVTDEIIAEKVQKLEALQQEVDDLNNAVALATEVERCRTGLAAVGGSASDPQEIAKQIKKLEVRKHELADDIAVVERYLQLKKQLRVVDLDVSSEDLEDLDNRISAVDERLEAASESLAQARLELSQIRKLRSRRNTIGENLERVPELEQEERVTRALCLAYGKTGLKLEKIKSIIQAIKANLPTWLKLTLTEPGFRVEVKDNAAALQLQVVQSNRVRNKKGAWETVEKRYDVRTASGGEQTRIMIALIMTLIEIIPQNKRTNLLILDEPEKGLDSVNRGLVSSILIPLLRNKRETMMLITHSLELSARDIDEKIIITRKKNKATITQGVQ